MFISCLGGVVTGLSQPANTYIFGDLTEALFMKSLEQNPMTNITYTDDQFLGEY